MPAEPANPGQPPAARRWQTRNPGPAVFSPCGAYRYRLERRLGPGPSLGVIMTNPSAATEEWDDPTIDRVQTVCARLGFGRAIMGNLFAWRSTRIEGLADAADPVGPENDAHLARIAAEADVLLVAWGPPGKLPRTLRNRWREVAALLDTSGKPLHCLTHLKGNHPRHPQILVHEDPLPVWTRPD